MIRISSMRHDNNNLWLVYFLFEVRLQMFTCITDLNVMKLAVVRMKFPTLKLDDMY